MMKVDYCLKTEKGNKIDEHRPRDELKQVNGNILLVQGPSSTGKSTVMNMIALGAYGEYNKNLSESVITDLKELSSASYRDLEFDIELSDTVTQTQLLMSKKSGKKDIKVIEKKDGEEAFLSQDSFEKRYRLIYDVPENPTKRLEQIRDTIKNDDREASQKVTNFLNHVRKIRSNVIDILSDEEIEAKKREYVIELNEIEALKEEIKKIKINKNDAECALLCKKYDTLSTELSSYEETLSRELSKPASNSSGEEIRTAAMKEFVSKLDKITINGPLRESIKRSRNAALIKNLKNLDSIHLETDYYLINEYTQTLRQMLDSLPESSLKAEKQNKYLNDVIKALQKCDSEMSLGDLGSVKDVLDELQKVKDSKPIDEFDYSSIRTGLKSMITNSAGLEKIADKIQNAETASNTPVRNQYLVESCREKIKNRGADREKVMEKMRFYGIPIDNNEAQFQAICGKLKISITSKESALEDLVNEFSNECDSATSELEKSERYVKNLKETIEKYDGVSKPPHFKDRDNLSKILDACGKIRSHIQEADSRLSKIEAHDDSEYRRNPELYQNIWDYIGYKLGTIRDCGKIYNVKAVNLLKEGKGDIETEDGAIIHIGAMGTGEGQLSYLRGLLSSDDDRMLIVLFDEVGNMSNDLISMLSDELKKIQKQGKLMLAFMARPTVDDFEVKILD